MNLDFQPTVSLAEHRITRRVRAGAPAPDVEATTAPAPSPDQGTPFPTVLAVFVAGLLIAIPSLAWLIRYLVQQKGFL